MINFDEEEVQVSNDQLKELTQLAKQQLAGEKEVASYEELLKKAKQDLYNIQEKALPDLMQAIGMESFALSNGAKITVKEVLYASIAKKNKPKAIRWLVAHDQGSLVKTDIILPFDKGDSEKVTEALDFLHDGGYLTTVDENVNTASVKAVIKELLAEGVDVPLELFGAYYARSAKITT